MVTMADVARQAGVSVSTVSHIVNGTRYVKEDTKKRVLAAIRETGYTPNSLARSLATQNTHTIGLAISAMSNFYFADIVAAMESAARAAGFTLLLADTHDDPDEELQVIQALHQRRVDGILYAPSTGSAGPALRYLAELSVPTVLVDRCAWSRFDQIGTENVRATAHLTVHLAERGHARIGLLAGHQDVRTFAERTEGYRAGLAEAGITPDDALTVFGPPGEEFAARAVSQLLALPDPPTALISGNNHLTIEIIRALRARGIKVPDDMALACFDDFEWADLFAPRLTAMAQPIEAIGAGAVGLLLDRLAEPKRPVRTIRLDPVFAHRESCGCPPE
ncbi:LacI family DNA-binding transcriptional regulator [Stackebrandtia nassauensis]|uniref:Transcriptional regulator, LacI family n=1 Tax=Stackebrandtia nassauensis (strain DSM 44728 / CIP 108903 / NRRL B-16338 / NBRC 102104 / LLR-40K-21) TaxID=446470 RepID=D3QAL9_STANL|nr:LacI family DNA-binding transcriptional regulator [Stackebrandtia nassauensis]ADD42802.1 transcriptional regulator, LacI family [Stackebrandtia nassauensis DSM 44728]